MVYVQFNYAGYFSIPGVSSPVYKSVSYLCGGTLIDKKTVLTAAHCSYRTISIQYNSRSYSVNVVPNSQYPTYASMFTVYLGVQNLNQLTSGIVASNLTLVSLHCFYFSRLLMMIMFY